MRVQKPFRYSLWLLLLVPFGLMGCPQQPTGEGNGNASTNGNGNTNDNGGGGLTGGFQDNGLAAPAALAPSVENAAPTGQLLFPPQGAAVGQGDVIFLWEAVDQNDTNLDSTLFLSDQPGVFAAPLVTLGVRTSPEESEHRLPLQLPDAGTYYWGVSVSDGVNTVQYPVDDVGVMFEVSETITTRIGLEDAVLLCPRETQPARAMTTFRWSLGNAVPTRTQVFVSRASVDNPFEEPLRIFDVPDPTALTRALAPEEALPVGETLSWGLRIETADEVRFSFAGQLGTSFLVAQNVAPSGELVAPVDGAVLTDNTSALALAWTADSGNCEDDLTSTVFFERLQGAAEPAALFESPVRQLIGAGLSELDLVPTAAALDLQAGRWAWGVLVDDGTDQTSLVDGVDPGRSFRTFVRDTAPVFLSDPSVGTAACELQQTTPGAVLAFSYADDNGIDLVNVTLSFAMSQAGLFDTPQATLVLAAGDLDGDVVVSLQNLGAPVCPEFAHDAGFYGVELNDGVNDPVQGVVEYAPVIPTGACCASDGTCSEGFPADCVGGSTYEGDGTTCATVQCPQPPPPPLVADCNGNAIPDNSDIANQTSLDCNLNGVPDECEGSPTVVDAGTLNPAILLQGLYDSAGNDLNGTICPSQPNAPVVWTVLSVPPGASFVDVRILAPASFTSPYSISPALLGDYVFQFTADLQGVQFSDTVTLTLTAQ